MPNEKELLEILLSNRGIKRGDWDKFLNPSYEEGIYDPFLLKDMERAVVRIFEAILAKEKIVIYTDYDCDGIPASVIMHDFFEKIGYENYSIYIPDRHDEGYGLNMEVIKSFIQDEVRLLITFDLGITAINETTEAQANGIDVIITDHHLPRRSLGEDGFTSDSLPQAYAILNPKQDECNYPDKNLCGAGVAFKLVQALVKKYGEYWKINIGWEKWLLDMAGLATLSDQVPLIGENRVLAFYGLLVLKKGKRPGLVELFNKSSINIKNINEEDVVFTLSPKINVASRLDDPMNAYKLLSTKDPVEAKSLSDHLIKVNDSRKIMVAHIMKDVKKLLSKREDKPVIVIGNPTWRIGVLGIVASKILDEHKKPVFVWGEDGNGLIRGSCRSIGEVNLVELMSSLPENSLAEFGGHKNAGGFSVSYEEIHFLEDRLVEVFDTKLTFGQNDKDYNIDAIISLSDVNNKNFEIINRLAPFGMANPKPIFMLKNIEIFEVKEFGKEQNHLELSFKNDNGKIIKAISFFKTRNDFGSEALLKEQKINLVATFEKNTFGGKNELRLRIVDIMS